VMASRESGKKSSERQRKGLPGITTLMNKQTSRGQLPGSLCPKVHMQSQYKTLHSEINETDMHTEGQSISHIGVIIHPYHPMSKEACNQSGKLVQMPMSLNDLLIIAGAIFGYTPNKVLSKDAAEIDNANLLRQNDHLYLIDDQIDAQEPDNTPEGIDCTQLIAGLERVVLALSNKID